MKWVEVVTGYLSKWTRGVRRYPVLLIFGAAMCGYLSYHIATDTEPQSRVFWSLWAGALISLIAGNLVELRQMKGLGWWQMLASLPVVVLMYLLMAPGGLNDHYWQNISGAVVIAMLHLAVSLVPFYTKAEEIFLAFNFRLLENMLLSFLASFVLFAGLSLAVLSVSTLFEIALHKGELYVHLSIWTLIGVHLINFISVYPSLPLTEKVKEETASRFFKVFVNYIGIPVVGVYALILIAYLIKITMSGQGVVSWISILCTWYLGVGIFVYLCSRMLLTHASSKAAEIFVRWFFPTLIVPMVLHFLSFRVFIEEQGFKEDVYMLGLALIYGFLLFLWSVIKKGEDLRIFPGLAILLLLVYILPGPLQVKTLSGKQQQIRLIDAATREGLIRNGKLMEAKAEQANPSDTLIQTLQYLNAHHDLEFLRTYDKSNRLGQNALIDTLKKMWSLSDLMATPEAEARRVHLFNSYYPVIQTTGAVTLLDVKSGPVPEQEHFSGYVADHLGRLTRLEKGVEKEVYVIKKEEIFKERISLKREGVTIDIYYKTFGYIPSGEGVSIFVIDGIAVRTPALQ